MQVRSGEVVPWVLEVFEIMVQSVVVIGVLELGDSCFCCSSNGPQASYVEEAATGAVTNVDSMVFVWNLLNH